MKEVTLAVLVMLAFPVAVVAHPRPLEASYSMNVTLYMEGEVPVEEARELYRVVLRDASVLCEVSEELQEYFQELLGEGEVYVGWEHVDAHALDRGGAVVFFTARKAVQASIFLQERPHRGCVTACEGVLVGVSYFASTECGCASGALTLCR